MTMNRQEWKSMMRGARAERRAHSGRPLIVRSFAHRGAPHMLKLVRRDGIRWTQHIVADRIGNRPVPGRIAAELEAAAGHRACASRWPYVRLSHIRGGRLAVQIARTIRTCEGARA